jgi:hypothetical protein
MGRLWLSSTWQAEQSRAAGSRAAQVLVACIGLPGLMFCVVTTSVCTSVNLPKRQLLRCSWLLQVLEAVQSSDMSAAHCSLVGTSPDACYTLCSLQPIAMCSFQHQQQGVTACCKQLALIKALACMHEHNQQWLTANCHRPRSTSNPCNHVGIPAGANQTR